MVELFMCSDSFFIAEDMGKTTKESGAKCVYGGEVELGNCITKIALLSFLLLFRSQFHQVAYPRVTVGELIFFLGPAHMWRGRDQHPGLCSEDVSPSGWWVRGGPPPTRGRFPTGADFQALFFWR